LLEIVSSEHAASKETALKRHHQEVIHPALAMIRADLARRFTVEELAAKSGYTTDHFVRVFRSVTGQSPNQWIIAQRMERAVALLRESSHTVTQIAGQLGYDDLAFFSRQFKKAMGVSPDQFRRR
jgi:two-component system response regulator YesN